MLTQANSQPVRMMKRLFGIATRYNSPNRESITSRRLSQQHRYLQSLSKRQLALLETHLHASVVSTVRDPVLDRDLASLDWLHRRTALSADGTVQLLLRLPTLLHPKLQELKQDIKVQAERAIKEWMQQEDIQYTTLPVVNVESIATTPWSMMARLVDDTDELLTSLGPGLSNVAHFVAVYSCKGGVGKSTVSVNLAYELARMGGRVGLLDLDVYGPSLPLLVHPSDVTIRASPLEKGMVQPILHEKVKLLSLGFVNKASGVPGSGQGNGASVMRGPMAGKVVSQLLKGTEWGELDVLILDLPPGTGDVQLQVLQDLQISGSVAVTTPSKLAAADTRRGIEMFTSLGVPTMAVVENMAYFVCEGGGKHYPFGRGLELDKGNSNGTFMGVSNLIQLPISEIANVASDSGEPFCLARKEESVEELFAFEELANAVSGELLKMQFGKLESQTNVTFAETQEVFDVATVHVSLDKPSETFTVRLFGESGAMQRKVRAASLRARDPKTGEILEDTPFKDLVEDSSDEIIVTIHQTKAKKSPSIVPTAIQKRGRYGYGIQWADGATIIYSMTSLARAAGGELSERNQQ